MSRRYFVCFLLLCAAMPAACRTSVQLADPPMTAPAAAVVGNRPPSVKIEGVSARVTAGTRLTLRSNVYDPDGDELTLLWTATAGTLERRVNRPNDVDGAIGADLVDDHAASDRLERRKLRRHGVARGAGQALISPASAAPAVASAPTAVSAPPPSRRRRSRPPNRSRSHADIQATRRRHRHLRFAPVVDAWPRPEPRGPEVRFPPRPQRFRRSACALLLVSGRVSGPRHFMPVSRRLPVREIRRPRPGHGLQAVASRCDGIVYSVT